jgi:hypothetical protein
MKQSAEERPIPTLQRKAAIARGAATDHTGSVQVLPIPNFDLDHTIFNTLEGALPRFVIKTRVAKEARWKEPALKNIDGEYEAVRSAAPLPEVEPALLRFMVEECDFDVEHADGSFLDHLYFCWEYTLQHYPGRSPVVMLLHSILGTGTNTFAMEAGKIPALRALMDDFEWTHVEAFPSVLRLLYDLSLRQELRTHGARLSELEAISFRRVIDNAPITMSAEDFWIQLNFQLIHLIDFLPVSNWSTHANDTAFIIFRDLYNLLQECGHLETTLGYSPATGSKSLTDEEQGFGGWLTTLIPVSLSEKMAAKSVRKFSSRIKHSMDYELIWKS